MSAAKSGIWNQVEQLVAEGKPAQILIPISFRLDKEKRPVGRPRVNPPGKPLHGQVMATPHGHQLRCRNPGCSQRLGKYVRDIVCGDKCRAELREYCETMLSILNGEVDPTDLPLKYRTITPVIRVKDNDETSPTRRRHCKRNESARDRTLRLVQEAAEEAKRLEQELHELDGKEKRR